MFDAESVCEVTRPMWIKHGIGNIGGANLAAISLGMKQMGPSYVPPAPTRGWYQTHRGLTTEEVSSHDPRQDSVGPICRTRSDLCLCLDAMPLWVMIAMMRWQQEKLQVHSKWWICAISQADGLRGKRLGISNYLHFGFPKNSNYLKFKRPLQTLRQGGAILVDHIKIPDYETIKDSMAIGEHIAMTELKLSLNAYLKGLITSPVRSLADIIAFNNKFSIW
ncbi:putative amidase [Camellia lanceoleosa]|uniref:Amidase n=1 Tax=Camellia lanceoleosa TaxID=1840588 RepID=A0ACC0IMX1_9ERIC|nr:putative amidase [Camellia lanceoleosa]